MSRHTVEAIEALWHRLATWRAAKVDPVVMCDVAAETLRDVVADLRTAGEAPRGRTDVAASYARLDAAQAERAAERARIFNAERGTL
jgi:hypothetical protein